MRATYLYYCILCKQQKGEHISVLRLSLLYYWHLLPACHIGGIACGFLDSLSVYLYFTYLCKLGRSGEARLRPRAIAVFYGNTFPCGARF